MQLQARLDASGGGRPCFRKPAANTGPQSDHRIGGDVVGRDLSKVGALGIRFRCVLGSGYAALLRGVSQLVSEQCVALHGSRGRLTTGHHDVAPDGERPCPQLVGHRRRRSVGVEADIGQILTAHSLHLRPQGSGYGVPTSESRLGCRSLARTRGG